MKYCVVSGYKVNLPKFVICFSLKVRPQTRQAIRACGDGGAAWSAAVLRVLILGWRLWRSKCISMEHGIREKLDGW